MAEGRRKPDSRSVYPKRLCPRSQPDPNHDRRRRPAVRRYCRAMAQNIALTLDRGEVVVEQRRIRRWIWTEDVSDKQGLLLIRKTHSMLLCGKVVCRFDGDDDQFPPCPFEREVQVRLEGSLVLNLHGATSLLQMIFRPAAPCLPIWAAALPVEPSPA